MKTPITLRTALLLMGALLLTASPALAQVPIIRAAQPTQPARTISSPIVQNLGDLQEPAASVVEPQAVPGQYEVAPSIEMLEGECHCQLPSCRRCLLQRRGRLAGGCVECPSCSCEICQLTTSETKVKKTCFKVEQETICIPTVRLPWQACCPPTTSRTRTVNRLKTHTYECPECSYKWSVVKPEEAAAEGASAPAPSPTSSIANRFRGIMSR